MRKVTRIWTTRDGTRIRICDMSDDHLKNTIKFLERQAKDFKLSVPFPMFQGEMAQWTGEQAYDAIQDADPEDLIPILSSLYMEKHRREGL